MAHYNRQTNDPQEVDFPREDLCNRDLQQQHHTHTGPTVQQPVYVQPVIQCEICNQTCTSKRELAIHFAGHTGKKVHKCDVCNKGFPDRSNLSRHYLIHTKAKPHVCEVCNKSFTRKDHLNLHSFIHSSQKPHVCHICQRGFTQKSNLRNHYMIHTGVRNHICNICNKGFIKKISLRVHYNVHSVDRKGYRQKIQEMEAKNKEAKEQQDQINIAIAKRAILPQVSESGMDQKQQDVDKEQTVIQSLTEPEHRVIAEKVAPMNRI